MYWPKRSVISVSTFSSHLYRFLHSWFSHVLTYVFFVCFVNILTFYEAWMSNICLINGQKYVDTWPSHLCELVGPPMPKPWRCTRLMCPGGPGLQPTFQVPSRCSLRSRQGSLQITGVPSWWNRAFPKLLPVGYIQIFQISLYAIALTLLFKGKRGPKLQNKVTLPLSLLHQTFLLHPCR